ncbi:protein SEMI-ROLLED LEAF 2 isoform X2 [Physcomitrium patens]|uniref:Uncharacterized protein n=1 Tax=Physcomitrium patens TaxID=3218 RepID=A0A2K1JX48_PHYPA|nr:uncharacterized protein LOC112287941 isoform X3 [Physcomitrium patens]PNR46108.1 hypothetical protein PHYPA_013227 [Physcomitrium patens]|eukprot:XP_024387366.1 uncharacterized protein LOC112287941 isoform X3 [Physcomitrella patens]
MGLISRRVLPICGSMCVCCPALRARSRQPVKRYNMLLADIYPKSQDEAPNDRKIGKLVEYAAKNPLRIPKIAGALEQKGYKELKADHFGTVTTVMRAFSKLFIDCRDEMSLFANNALNLIKVLLDQVAHGNMRIVGCLTLVDFIRVQTDATYMRNLDGLTLPLCALAREQGDDKKQLAIRAAALQALAALVGFTAQHSQISTEFDKVVAATLENYELPSVEIEALEIERGEPKQQWMREVMRSEGHSHALQVMREALNKMHRHKAHTVVKDQLNLTSEETEAPSVWSQICIQNMAALAKEATTVRRVLDPMFRYLDAGKHWSMETGLALIVLQNMQFLMEQTGNGQLLLAALVRHLDQKNVESDLIMKRNILAVTAVLARQSKSKATVAEIGAMSDLSKHLRRSLQASMETSMAGSVQMCDDNILLQAAVEECLMEFGSRVGDAGPLLDMMAATLEKLSVKTVVARSTLQAVSVLALVVAYLPDHLYVHQEFPESLFKELLQAMLHPDLETRIGAHRVFILLLVPSSVSQSSRYEHQFLPHSDGLSPSRGKRRVSAFSSAAALFERLRRERSLGGSFLDNGDENGKLKGRTNSIDQMAGKADSAAKGDWELEGRSDSFDRDDVHPGRGDNSNGAASPSRLQAFRLSLGRSMAHLRRPSTGATKETETNTARLSVKQTELLFSTLWLQSKMADNWPSSYEAMAHTYSLTLLFGGLRSANHNTHLRALQLALSIRILALDSSAVHLSPARRRSLFTLATGMLVFAAKVCNIPQIVAPAKVPLTSLVKDPFLELSEDNTLTALNSAVYAHEYTTESDDNAALSSLSRISLVGDLSNDAIAGRIIEAISSYVKVEGVGIKERLTQQFTPEASELLKPQLYSESLNARSPHASQDSVSFDEVLQSQLTSSVLEDGNTNGSNSELPPMLRDTAGSTPIQAPGVSQLLDQAKETAEQVGLTHAPSGPLSYSATASRCEAAGAGAHRKMSAVLNLDSKSVPFTASLPPVKDSNRVNGHESPSATSDTSGDLDERTAGFSGSRSQSPKSKPTWLASPTVRDLKLPPSSPYDNFLKAAGC